MAKKLVTINLDEDLITALDDLKMTVGISRSAMVNLVLRSTVIDKGLTSSEILTLSRIARAQ